MPSDYSALAPWAVVTLVLAVGAVLSVFATRRLERPVAWLCGAGCLVLFAVHLLRFLWAADIARPAQGRVLYRTFELGLQFTPFVEAVGLVLVVTAALRGNRTRESSVPAEPRPVRPREPIPPLRTVAVPVWAVGATVALAGGALIAVAAVIPTDDGVPRLVRGTVTAHVGDGFRFVADGDHSDPEVYWPHSRFWVDNRGAQRNGDTPACLRSDVALPQRVELAFLDVKGGREYAFGDFPYLLSVRCLD